MKTFKPLIILFIAVALCLSFVSCSSNSIIGTWETEIDGDTGIFVFAKDGRCTASINGKITMEGSYSIDGDNLTVIPDDDNMRGQTLHFEVKGDALFLTDEVGDIPEVMELTRK